MTTRLHRLWQAGDPQRRVFLPNFWMKLIKPIFKVPSNHVLYKIPMEMTANDVRQYLTRIYSLPVREVRTIRIPGKISRDMNKGYSLSKEPDEQIAHVVMDRSFVFAYPNLVPEKKLKEQEKQQEMLKRLANKSDVKVSSDDWTRPGVPKLLG